MLAVSQPVDFLQWVGVDEASAYAGRNPDVAAAALLARLSNSGIS